MWFSHPMSNVPHEGSAGLLSTAEAAALLGKSPATINRWAEDYLAALEPDPQPERRDIALPRAAMRSVVRLPVGWGSSALPRGA